MLPERLLTADKTIDCATPEPMADLARLAREFADGAEQPLRLIGRRHVRSNNSWMHNYRRLVKGKPRHQLQVNPADLESLGLADGARARLSSRAGAVDVEVQACEDLMPGVVSLPTVSATTAPASVWR